MRRILLKQAGQLYRLLQYELRDHADGSLYIIVDRQSDVSGAKPKRISYHASGRVEFHGIDMPALYFEPVFEVTRQQPLFALHFPTIEKLNPVMPESGDFQIEVADDFCGPYKFEVSIGPSGILSSNGEFAISYQGLLDIKLRPGQFPELPEPHRSLLTTHFIFLPVQRGAFVTQQISKYEALIAFHQKKVGYTGIIPYWNPSNGAYRFIYSVEMRVAPKINVKFVDSNYVAVVEHCTPAEVRFRAKGPGGFVTDKQILIRSVELDAEL
jgi:hypothetical protein